jgi:type II secretory pathway pseudopilin PulG
VEEMSMFWIVTISVIAVIVLAIITGIVAWRLFRAVDGAMDDFQRKINKLENLFAEAGASWMSEFLEDWVVGDTAACLHKLKEFVEAPNTPLFFLEKIALPCARYAIREATPEIRAKLQTEFTRNAPSPDTTTGTD